jgi:hypothetical protein
MFRFGEAAGAIYGLLVGMNLPVTFVRPQQWQRFHQVGAAPDAARQRAMQPYPALAPLLARKRDHHRADALLLGHYGLRVPWRGPGDTTLASQGMKSMAEVLGSRSAGPSGPTSWIRASGTGHITPDPIEGHGELRHLTRCCWSANISTVL